MGIIRWKQSVCYVYDTWIEFSFHANFLPHILVRREVDSPEITNRSKGELIPTIHIETFQTKGILLYKLRREQYSYYPSIMVIAERERDGMFLPMILYSIHFESQFSGALL